MLHTYSRVDANVQWFLAVKDVMSNGWIREGRDQSTKELLHVVFEIADPRRRYIFSRPINPAFAFAELVWIMNGSDDLEFLKFWNPRMANYSDNGVYLRGAYGGRLREMYFDQLYNAYKALEAEPNSRQVVLQIWNAELDMPYHDGKPKSKDIPCNIVSHLMIRDNKLEWLQVMRSNDAIFGTPYNFIQWTTLQEVLAGWLNVDAGSYVHMSDSFHIYQRHWEHAEQLEFARVDYEPDDLRLPYEESTEVWELLWELALDLADTSDIPVNNTLKAGIKELPTSYMNLLYILAADALRIKGDIVGALELSTECTNAAYRYLYKQWWETKQVKDGD